MRAERQCARRFVRNEAEDQCVHARTRSPIALVANDGEVLVRRVIQQTKRPGAHRPPGRIASGGQNAVCGMHQLIHQPPVRSCRPDVERGVVHHANRRIAEKGVVDARARRQGECEGNGARVEVSPVGEGDTAREIETHRVGLAHLPSRRQRRCNGEFARQPYQRFAEASVERVATESVSIERERRFIGTHGDHHGATSGRILAARPGAAAGRKKQEHRAGPDRFTL